MSVRKVMNHGRPRYLVEIGKGEGGRRLRKFFPTRDAADAFLRGHRDGLKRHGVDWAMRFDSLTTHEKTEMLSLMDRLHRLGFTLRELVEMAERGKAAGPSVTVDSVVREFLADKQTRGLRPRSFRKLRTSLEMFLTVVVRERPIREISTAEIRDFLHRNGWSASTRKSYLGDVRSLFRFAAKRKYTSENPAEILETPLLEDKAPGILTVPQAKAIVEACQLHTPSLLAWLVLSLFAGVRAGEARRIAWNDLSGDYIEVKAGKAKTRRRRLIPITPQLRAWLDAAKAAGSDLPPIGWQKRWKALRIAAGTFSNWSQNALRHSFASYHLAGFRNAQETALLMGNSPQMLFAHYRELVRPEDAAAFFGLLPNDGFLTEGVAVERQRRTAVNEVRRTVSLRYWASVREKEAAQSGELVPLLDATLVANERNE